MASPMAALPLPRGDLYSRTVTCAYVEGMCILSVAVEGCYPRGGPPCPGEAQRHALARDKCKSTSAQRDLAGQGRRACKEVLPFVPSARQGWQTPLHAVPYCFLSGFPGPS